MPRPKTQKESIIEECKRKVFTIESLNHELLKSPEIERERLANELDEVLNTIKQHMHGKKKTQEEYVKDKQLKELSEKRERLEERISRIDNQINASGGLEVGRALWITKDEISELHRKLKQENEIIGKIEEELKEVEERIELLRSDVRSEERELLDLECKQKSLEYYCGHEKESKKFIELKIQLLMKREEDLFASGSDLSVQEVIASKENGLSEVEHKFSEETLKILGNQLKLAEQHERIVKGLMEKSNQKPRLLEADKEVQKGVIKEIKQAVKETIGKPSGWKQESREIQKDRIMKALALGCEIEGITLEKRKEILEAEIKHVNDEQNILLTEAEESLIMKLVSHEASREKLASKQAEISKIWDESKKLREIPRKLQVDSSLNAGGSGNNKLNPLNPRSFESKKKSIIGECERKVLIIEPWNQELLKSLENDERTSENIQQSIVTAEKQIEKLFSELNEVSNTIREYVSDNRLTKAESMKDMHLKELHSEREKIEKEISGIENEINDAHERYSRRALWITKNVLLALNNKLKKENEFIGKIEEELNEVKEKLASLRRDKKSDERELLDLECKQKSLEYYFEHEKESKKFLELKRNLLEKQQEELLKSKSDLSAHEVLASEANRLSDLAHQYIEETRTILETQLELTERHEKVVKELREKCNKKLQLLQQNKMEKKDGIKGIKQAVKETMEKLPSWKQESKEVQSDIIVSALTLERDAEEMALSKRKEILQDEIKYINDGQKIMLTESTESLVPKLISHNESHKKFTAKKMEILKIVNESKKLREIPRKLDPNPVDSDAHSKFVNAVTNTAYTAQITQLFLSKQCAPDVIPEKPSRGKHIKLKLSYHDRKTFNVIRFLSEKLSDLSLKNGKISNDPSLMTKVLPGISFMIIVNMIVGNVHFDPATVLESEQYDIDDPLFQRSFIPMFPFIPHPEMNAAFSTDSPTLSDLLRQNKTYKLKIPVNVPKSRRPALHNIEIDLDDILHVAVRTHIHERTDSVAIIKQMYEFQSKLCKCQCHPWNLIHAKQLSASDIEAQVKLKSLQLTLTPIRNLEELQLLSKVKAQSLDVKKCLDNPVHALCDATPSQRTGRIHNVHNNVIWLAENISSATSVDHHNHRVLDSMLYKLTCCHPTDPTIDTSSLDFDSHKHPTDNNLQILSSYVSTSHRKSSVRIQKILDNFGKHHAKELILATTMSSAEECQDMVQNITKKMLNEFSLIKIQLCRTHAHIKDRLDHSEEKGRSPIKRLFKKVTHFKQLESQLKGLENLINAMEEKSILLGNISEQIQMQYDSDKQISAECVNNLIELMDPDNKTKLRAETIRKTSGTHHHNPPDRKHHLTQKSREIHFYKLNEDLADDTLDWNEVLGDDNHDLPSNILNDPNVLHHHRKKDLDLS